MNSERDRFFRMPAEWELQSATWVSWPHNSETWPHNLKDAQTEFVNFVRTVAESQKVFVLADSSLSHQANLAIGHHNVELVPISNNDAWIRDYGPTFVKQRLDDKLVAVIWRYNAWGGKYPPFERDQKVAVQIANFLGIEAVPIDFCFEGGAIEMSQSRIGLSTICCALDPARNPGMSLDKATKLLRKSLGAKSILWLKHGVVEGDDTDGHVDQIARFTNNHTLVYASIDRPNAQAAIDENLNYLQEQIANQGVPIQEMIPLPCPPRVKYGGRVIPASYCNFLICNELVVVPQFGFSEDQIAIEILTHQFPGREVVGLPSRHLAVGLGSFHCLSQQQPN